MDATTRATFADHLDSICLDSEDLICRYEDRTAAGYDEIAERLANHPYFVAAIGALPRPLRGVAGHEIYREAICALVARFDRVAQMGAEHHTHRSNASFLRPPPEYRRDV